ncbi:sigma-70 family RNA polymerase sigma factor [Chitinophaga sp. SYP-B3965]|uniref:RNA polymerase sigma factor n=1 Tax=Chitinophaga sp. SYP-B3965 TaxID=2663120 RepID=UPI001299C959|nr:sigma-70 family RNA polymerase sigma factor [Chitinophaga sp. SYP-B3965]MRG47948.1 sigma-70 family RNA polymerase sigma factor [Chitinophaga sp. SYP-B3965]
MDTPYFADHIADQVDLDNFDVLYHQYHQAVYANIWKVVKQHEAAEDILQEVFLALWENREKLDAAKVAGWLFVTSFNKSIKYLKQKEREKRKTVDLYQEEPLSEELYTFRLSIVEEAVNHLPERKKEVFRLCRYEGKSYDEVAHILGISVTSVKDYLKQSTRFIKDYISHHQAESLATGASLLLFYLS